MFAPHQYDKVVLSDIGIGLWLGTIIACSYYRGFAEIFRLYLVPYLWYAVSAHLFNIDAYYYKHKGQSLVGADYVPSAH